MNSSTRGLPELFFNTWANLGPSSFQLGGDANGIITHDSDDWVEASGKWEGENNLHQNLGEASSKFHWDPSSIHKACHKLPHCYG
jgi:hypothetical protein